MLKLKRIICLLSIIILFNNYNISIVTPFNALATDVVDDKNVKITPKDASEDKIEIDNIIEIKSEKIEQKKMINKAKKNDDPKNNEPEWKEFILTFYTSLESENSSAGSVTCQNKPLSPGGVANNVIPQNTKLYLEGYGQVTVNDKGSDKYFGVDNRLDVFIERKPGESDKQYAKRVNSYGVQKVKGYIIK